MTYDNVVSSMFFFAEAQEAYPGLLAGSNEWHDACNTWQPCR